MKLAHRSVIKQTLEVDVRQVDTNTVLVVVVA